MAYDVATLLPAGTGSGVTGVTLDAGDLVEEATFQLVVPATTTAMSLTLQGSLDGVNWAVLPLNKVDPVSGAKTALTQPFGTVNTGAAVEDSCSTAPAAPGGISGR